MYSEKDKVMNTYTNITAEEIQEDMRYLQLLAHSYPTIADASTEIINLQAILNLPKGTEHFLADLHGEYEAFQHVLKNAPNKSAYTNVIISSIIETRRADDSSLRSATLSCSSPSTIFGSVGNIRLQRSCRSWVTPSTARLLW